MKSIIFCLVFGVYSFALAGPGDVGSVGTLLEGRSYCRKIQSGGMFGQPRGERKHCISFSEGNVIDNANTFFGKPPERTKFSVKGRVVKSNQGEFVVSEDLSQIVVISGSAKEGTVLTLEE